MDTNHTLATLSDVSFGSAFVVYLVALVLSVVAYSRKATLVTASPESLDEAKRARFERQINRFAGMAQMLVWLGVVIHATSVVLRGLSAHRFPFGNLYEYLSMITLGMMIIAAAVVALKQVPALWPWLIAPVLILMFMAGTKLYAHSAPVVPALQSIWLPIHVSAAALGASLSMISGAFSVVYLLRSHCGAKKTKGLMARVLQPLPTAAFLDRMAYKTAVWALPIFGLGVAFGAVWASQSWGRFWNWDPKETCSFITWIILAAYLHARATPRWSKRVAAWINVVALLTMIMNLTVVNQFSNSLHSYAGLN